jgi:N-acetylmuramoyl-L-alanine amidase
MSRFRWLFLFIICFCLSFSVFSQEKSIPRKGEGIHSFLLRNNRPPQKYTNEFIELNKHKLGKNNSLILGVSYELPSLKKASTPNNKKLGSKHKEPLFGKIREEYTIESLALSGACYFLVSGHGGPDPGAIAKVDGKELHEDEYAYDIMLRLAKNLMEHGATVHIIIQDKDDGIRDGKYLKNSNSETCMGEPIPRNQAARLRQRSNTINLLSQKATEKYQRAIFIHLDSRKHKNQIDVFFYHKPQSVIGEKFANNVRNTIESQYKRFQPNRGFSGTVSERNNLYVLNATRPVSIFAELGNMQNAFDQRRYIQEDNRQALANWLLRGFIKDYEDSKKK